MWYKLFVFIFLSNLDNNSQSLTFRMWFYEYKPKIKINIKIVEELIQSLECIFLKKNIFIIKIYIPKKVIFSQKIY